MSDTSATHRDVTESFKDDSGRVYSQVRCACGWESIHRHYGFNHDQKKAEYKQHVLDVLGPEMGYYSAPVHCVNCTYRGEAQLLIGHDVWQGTCPRCNCDGRLRPMDLHDERVARGEVA